MNEVCEFRDLIVKKAISKNLDIIGDASLVHGIATSFSKREFFDFHYDVFDIYEYHNEVYKYMEELELSIIVALENNIYNHKKLSLEDIRDGIFYVKTVDDNKFSNIRVFNKIKYLKENWHGRRKYC